MAFAQGEFGSDPTGPSPDAPPPTPSPPAPKSSPAVPASPPADHRVPRDRIDKTDKLILCYRSKLLHLGIGRRHVGTRVIPLVADRDVGVMNDDGEFLAKYPPRCTKPKRPGQRT
jgi:hypothetical protein